MEHKYLICDVSILPECYAKVVEARSLVETGKAKDVSEAVRMIGISRSTYYKYKDYLFAPGSDTDHGKKAILSFNLTHKTGALSEVLSLVSQMNANILTINQNLPVNGKAYITLSVEFSQMVSDPTKLVHAISACSGVSSVKLVAIE